MSINRWLEQQMTVSLYSRWNITQEKKEWATHKCNKMDESQNIMLSEIRQIQKSI